MGRCYAKRYSLLIICVLALSTSYAQSQTVRVVQLKGEIRLNPTEDALLLSTVSAGTVLDVIKERGDWYEIWLPPDETGMKRTGFIHERYVEFGHSGLATMKRTTPATASLPPELAAAIGDEIKKATERGDRDEVVDVPLISDERVLEGIRIGRDEPNSKGLVAACSAGAGFGAHMSRQSGLAPYQVSFMTELGYIATYSYARKKLTYRDMTPADVSPDMRRRLVYVIVSPQRGYHDFPAPLIHLVIRAKSNPEKVAQPLSGTTTDTSFSENMSGIVGSHHTIAFRRDDVVNLPDGDLEMVLVTETGERRCKIGKKERNEVLGR